MKSRYEFVRTVWVIASILFALEIIMVIIEPDLKHCILTGVVGVGWSVIFVFMIILRIEKSRMIFDCEEGELKIRLVDFEDFQMIRVLCDATPIENSKEEMNRLSDYEKKTVDYVRIRFHYLVLKGEEAVGLFRFRYKKDRSTVTWIACKEEEKQELNRRLLSCAKKKEIELTIEEER